MAISITSKLIAATAALGVLAVTVVGVYWDKEPAGFNVADNTAAFAASHQHANVTGTATIITMMKMVDTLFTKQGGFLANDILPPGLLMDNVPQWEYGVLLQVRDMSRALNERIGHKPEQADNDADLALAETRFAIEHSSWMMPDAEAEYHEGNDYLNKYLERLSNIEDPDAYFNTRAENLDYWLAMVEVRLGSLTRRLAVSAPSNDNAPIPSNNKAAIRAATNSWFKIDDVFYEARGSSWALIQLLQAVQVDFTDVVKDKNAADALAEIIHELKATQQNVSSPMILNGSGFGLWANHSLVMASYVSRANVAVGDLRKLLARH